VKGGSEKVRGRVLIVEDEAVVADDLENQLLQLGYEVAGVAASGREAIALAGESRPHVVLMDVQLQGAMTGPEAANIIQKNTGAAIVFITAFAAVFIRDPAQLTAPGICLSKPFSPVQLRAALDAVMPVTETESGHEQTHRA
jgi:CheY-like chemotaxis protein